MHSNCLFEALKAKIKHPNTVQILFLKGGVFGKYSHFMWRENDEVKHAYNPKTIKAFEDLREGMQYKFITPFDSDYVALNSYLKSKKLSYELGD